MLSHGVAIIKQINGYFKIDIFASEKHHRIRKNRRDNKDDNRWWGLTRIRTNEISRNFGHAKKHNVRPSQWRRFTRERYAMRFRCNTHHVSDFIYELITFTFSKKSTFLVSIISKVISQTVTLTIKVTLIYPLNQKMQKILRRKFKKQNFNIWVITRS